VTRKPTDFELESCND